MTEYDCVKYRVLDADVWINEYRMTDKENSSQADNDMWFNILVIGGIAVGKTNLLSRNTDGEFTECYIPTIGMDFATRTDEVEGKMIRYAMFERPSQPRFPIDLKPMYKNPRGFMIVVDLTSMQSFLRLEHYIEQIINFGKGHVPIVLLGNKADMEDERTVPLETIKELAEQIGIQYFEASAKTGVNVNHAFVSLITEIKHRIDDGVFDTHEEIKNIFRKEENVQNEVQNEVISEAICRCC